MASSTIRCCGMISGATRRPPLSNASKSLLLPHRRPPPHPHLNQYQYQYQNRQQQIRGMSSEIPAHLFQLDQLRTLESGQLGTLSYSMYLKRQQQQQQQQSQTPSSDLITATASGAGTGGGGAGISTSPNALQDVVISFWHDIALKAPSSSPNSPEGMFHFVNEIPMGTKLKMEVNTKKEHNPIQQDTKNDNPRVFMYGNIPFNYGCFPQTWENPNFTHPDTKCGGDNDPVDVVELGSPLPIGKILRVKILGSFALIDAGETDWKILAIREDDPIAQIVNDIDDIRKKLPAKLETIYNWFRYYKTSEGKPENKFALDGRPTDKKYATQIVEDTHAAWKQLLDGQAPQGKLWIPPANHNRPTTNTSSSTG